MRKYKNISGKGGVSTFEILKNAIVIEFGYKERYLYDYTKPGKKHVEQMKHLAVEGKGLTTYINKYVRNNYSKKL